MKFVGSAATHAAMYYRLFGGGFARGEIFFGGMYAEIE
jgi:hypothetical protein